MLAFALAAAALGAAPGTGAAQERDAAQRLAERHAPIVVVRDQEEACDRSGEAYRPVPVETVLGVPEIALLGGDGQVVTRAPTAADIAGLGPETAIDLPGNPRRPGCGYERDFQRLGAGQPDVSYAHIATDPDEPGRLALQYWFFWYFDDYVNTHEGDWEFIQLAFDAPDAEAALATEPVRTGYSQHSGGEWAEWDGDKLERVGSRPVVYSAAGSHANYYTSDLFLGRNADQGFGCDNTRAPTTRLPTEARLLPSNPRPGTPEAWLLFEGRWGEPGRGAYNGPTGPYAKDQWHHPFAWQERLRDASFDVPTGNSFGPAATDAFCTLVRAGGQVYTAITSPVVLLLVVLGLVTTGGIAVRATAWSPPGRRPLRRPRRAGQMMRAAWGAYRDHPASLLALGALFLPAAIVETAAVGLVFSLTPLGDLAGVAGESSVMAGALALLVAGAGHILAASVVIAGVALVMDAADAGRPTGPRAAYAMLARRLWPVLGTAGLVALATTALAVTVVGIPVAIWCLGRWAVAVQASAIDGLRPRAALRRSAQLTNGRWWRATRLAALVNVAGYVSGPAVGIALLFLTTLTLVTINAISSLVYVLTMPLVGAALALLHGDLVARARGEREG